MLSNCCCYTFNPTAEIMVATDGQCCFSLIKVGGNGCAKTNVLKRRNARTPLFVIESSVTAPWVQEVLAVERKVVDMLVMVTLCSRQHKHFPNNALPATFDKRCWHDTALMLLWIYFVVYALEWSTVLNTVLSSSLPFQ
jgi:hypothetical protein